MIDTITTEIAEGEERIRLEVADGIAVLTLCRPDTLNGWSWESTRQLGLLADRIRFDPAARVVLLRAEGRAFCAGIDVTAPGGAITGASAAERTRNYYEGIRWVHERFAVLTRLPQPVVAAVQGYCLGFGFELALMADIRVAAEDAVFALPEAQLGVAVDAGGDLRIAREAGAGWAKLLALTGRRIDAPTAERLHLVQLVVPGPDLDSTARALATEIAANAPLAVQGIKRAVDAYADAALPAALDRVAMTAALTLTSEDSREGYTAKAARRPPHFTGG
ncbi:MULTISPECIES: enoyl-CoA hydratase/isomerase family protein [unclassified Streptomyces]|uniref:enoyl-CoA hydratase/isomerase family protein n=1 Tax=unclassified Streptomyces TaxID=2593676 RepID=UPI001BE89170|nr:MULTISPECIES: enoyl-CoA hydratase/isomerase family protein [unclassified Streptomyces]MBT2405170.1 enoyl-CoA hydratase/isomerase family protein [Streptomyces sp. ISL-21]MBT2610938.1 enoyl-CoA hydratase/isomerase family protein [Streptomyces sp. ISL-87]